MESIGVRELRQHASRYLQRVAAGERFTITDRGTPVAELGPVSASPLQALIDQGLVVPAVQPFGPVHVPRVRLGDSTPSASVVLQQQRADLG